VGEAAADEHLLRVRRHVDPPELLDGPAAAGHGRAEVDDAERPGQVGHVEVAAVEGALVGKPAVLDEADLWELIAITEGCIEDAQPLETVRKQRELEEIIRRQQRDAEPLATV